MNTHTALRREQMAIGLHVGLREGGHGELLHGVIDSLDDTKVHVWIPDQRYSPALPKNQRGYLTALTYQQAEAGAMWARFAIAHPGGTTGADLIAFLAWAKAAGLVDGRTVTGYRTAARQVLAAQPDGQRTDVSADPAPTVHRFAAARRRELAPATLAQYASGYRRARHLFLQHRAAAHPGATDLNGDALADLKALARAWQEAANGEGGDEEHDAAAALADAVIALPDDGPDADPGDSAGGDAERDEPGGTR